MIPEPLAMYFTNFRLIGEIVLIQSLMGKSKNIIKIINILFLLLLRMLLISTLMELWKICISSLCSIGKLLFPSFSIFYFFLQLQICSSVSQIIKELCSSSSYSFHIRHLSFDIMKKAIPSQNMTNPIRFSTQNIIQK